MNEEEKKLFKTSIRKALYEQDVFELMKLVPNIEYEYACECIKEYQINYEDMKKRMINNQNTEKENNKENNLLSLLLELSQKELSSEMRKI